MSAPTEVALEKRGPGTGAPTDACGDLLLAFGSESPPSAGRVAGVAWSPVCAGGEGMLFTQPPSAGWRGFPLREVSRSTWRLWRVGETYGVATREAEEALLLDVAEGRRPASDLNGHLLLLGWNSTSKQWHAWTDRFGTVHAYLARADGSAALGTFFPGVAAVASRRRLDWTGLAGFFAFGFFPRTLTHFDDVRILRPASHVVLDAEGRLLRGERYWAWRHEPDPRRSYDDTVDAFAAVLQEVLDGEASGRLAIPISGGLDSRTTVAALTRPGAPGGGRLWSYSYGYTFDSMETRIGAAVARARNLPFEALTIGPYLFDRLGSVLSCVEGFQDVTQARQAVVTDPLAARSDAVMAAHWGDVWLDDMGLVGREAAAPAEVLDHAFQKMAKRGRRWLLEKIASPRFGGEMGAVLHDHVAQELAPLAGIADPDFRVKAFKTEQWSFRWTLASLRMYQAGAFPRLPFYDTRLTDFFATVPSAFVAGRRLQIDYLKRFAPDLARIRWQAYDTNLFRYRYFDSLLLPARAWKKAMRLLRRRQTPARNWEVQFLTPDGRRRLEEALLGGTRRLHELVAPGVVKDLLERFHAEPLGEGRGYTVSMLLTLSAWLETYA